MLSCESRTRGVPVLLCGHATPTILPQYLLVLGGFSPCTTQAGRSGSRPDTPGIQAGSRASPRQSDSVPARLEEFLRKRETIKDDNDIS
jgi:hypothetical protein